MKKLGKYIQEMPQSHTKDQLMALEESKNDKSAMTFRTQQK